LDTHSFFSVERWGESAHPDPLLGPRRFSGAASAPPRGSPPYPPSRFPCRRNTAHFLGLTEMVTPFLCDSVDGFFFFQSGPRGVIKSLSDTAFPRFSLSGSRGQPDMFDGPDALLPNHPSLF